MKIVKVAIFLASLFLFMLAITLMQAGARALAPLIDGSHAAANPMRTLGFGWLGAYLLLSGSPIAAAALAFLDVGALNGWSTFTMITGSRIGASLTVFFFGFLYVLRGRDRATSLSMGLLSLAITGSTHLLGLFVGFVLLHMNVLDGIQVRPGLLLNSLFDRVFQPLTHILTAPFPPWFAFFIGLGIIIISFSLFDRCLPQMTIKESYIGQVAQLVYQPWVMLLLGAGITLLSMSVTISLGILVPLNDRGFIRRENVIPYVMGANVTTFIDTLVAAVLLDSPLALTVVLAEMASITFVSIFILATSYRRYEHAVLAFVMWTTATNRNLLLLTLAIIVVPSLLALL